MPQTASPMWSVMIPTYNSDPRYLRQTLESVLVQDPGPAQMQIEIVDNCSNQNNPELLLAELGLESRVRFHRNPVNLGAYPNHNVCIQRSQGQLVHILHSDDFVAPDFYSRIESLANACPDAALIASRVFIVDQNSKVIGATKVIRELKSASRDCSGFYYANPLQFAGTVVRRAHYQAHDGFMADFAYCADQEMWARVISTGGGAVLPEPLAYYRAHGQSDQSPVVRMAQHLAELDRLGSLFASRHPGFSESRHRKRLARSAWKQAERFRKLGIIDGYEANLAFWKTVATPLQRAQTFPRRLHRRMFSGDKSPGVAPPPLSS